MKNISKITTIIIVLTVVILLAYDCYALVIGGTEGTISYQVIVSSYKYPLIPFFFGFLMGHFFWRMRDTEETKKISDSSRL